MARTAAAPWNATVSVQRPKDTFHHPATTTGTPEGTATGTAEQTTAATGDDPLLSTLPMHGDASAGFYLTYFIINNITKIIVNLT